MRFDAGGNDQHSSRIDQAAARVRRGRVQASTRSENARKPVLIWSDSAEKRIEPVMNVSASFFEYPDEPSAIDRETSIAIMMFISRSACVCRT